MKHYIRGLVFVALISSLAVNNSYAQMRIGAPSSTSINPAASLEISAGPYADNSYKGLLLPKVALIDYSIWTLAGSPVDGMIVYNTATSTGDYVVTPGVYCWYNFQWNRLVSAITPAILSMLDCQTNNPASGTYLNRIALTSSNTKQITITPKSAGIYSITTKGINGYSFSTSGSFTTAQVGTPQTINLQGAGIPQNVGVDSFTVTTDGQSQSCPFSVTVNTFVDCNGPTTGTIKVNKYLDSTNTKQITVIPYVAGKYSFSALIYSTFERTPIGFGKSVVFTDAQVGVPQTVILTGNGYFPFVGTYTGELRALVGNNTNTIVLCTISITVVP